MYEDELVRTSTRKREKPNKVKKIEIEENITVRDLAAKLEISGSDAVRKLVQMGVMVSVNQELEFCLLYTSTVISNTVRRPFQDTTFRTGTAQCAALGL